MTHATQPEVQEFLSAVGAELDTRRPWQQLDCCPACGSDTGFAILVREHPAHPEIPVGTFTCRSSNCTIKSGSLEKLRDLLAVDGVKRSSGTRKSRSVFTGGKKGQAKLVKSCLRDVLKHARETKGGLEE